MLKQIEAVFDGKVFRPEEPLELEPNSRVMITIESVEAAPQKKVSFLQVAQSLNLEGPVDWSANIESYLYDEESRK